MSLNATYVGHAFLSSTVPPPPSQLSPEEIGHRIEAQYAAARQRWSGVDLEIAAFARALGTRCATQSPLFESSRVLAHAGDVYLAVACESGDGAALAAFDRAFLRDVGKHVAKVRRDNGFADEVAQEIREKLFLGGADGRPRIGDYDGSGPLASWVRVMSVRLALNQVRGAGERLAVDHASAALAAIPAKDNPEVEYAKLRHAREFREALVEALNGLPDEQRALLKFYYLNRQSTPELARIFGVNQSTIFRRLTEAREALVASAHASLKARLRLDDRQLDSLAQFVRSRIGESFLAGE